MAPTAAVWRFQKPLAETCRVVLAGPHFQAGLVMLSEQLEANPSLKERVQLHHAPTRKDLMAAAPSAHVALPFMERFDAAFLNQAVKLRLVMQFGVGLEGIDMVRASERGIAVSNIPANQTGNAEATAEHAVFLAMSLLRHGNDFSRRFQARELGGLPIPRTLCGKRVTVVGYGAVGKCLTRYLAALGAHVTAVRRRPWTNREPNDSIQRADTLNEALPTSDVVILACPITSETVNMMNDETLAVLPSGALLVNVGRGPLVEYNAITRALESCRVGGFASDVGVGHPDKPSEPWDPSDPLSSHADTIFTPHVGGYCDVSYDRMSEAILEAISCVIEGKPPAIWVNRA